jgi:hypothetical protein
MHPIPGPGNYDHLIARNLPLTTATFRICRNCKTTTDLVDVNVRRDTAYSASEDVNL